MKIEVACAIIERDGLVLVAQRSASMSRPLKWEFPGGKLEAHESAGACLKREIFEELGVMVLIGAPLPPSDWQYPNLTVTLYPFVCALLGGELRLAEHKAVQWVHPNDLHLLDWAEADVPVVNSYRRHLGLSGAT